ncbi:nuclear transport factor 2 family protein [Gilvimarinus sp. SDUM040013]|uniref:Nuclear transport factor 2 family protein n=1 Tax=Gilvimarinus gilvus TaxID=3058038 RepID=A0ABU4RZ70_9GAMM|nr:nuclear transport factor 2 family protein [Gilvimarinus sp. SDUM040013]MDO3388666.1 nuclear transport factor 2 family protein [Gilvimarinus sp. SDUM040013]MDX6849561.1 nuclear transport factor 2 family protein [Gilvimarinus sp. SDUM040013]
MTALSGWAQNIAVVESQAAAYNEHDVEKYASYFHPDIEVYNYPDTPLTAGRLSLIDTTTDNFSARSPTSEILNTIEINNKVITHELATFKVNGQRQNVAVVKIYEFKNGLIRRMTFLN